MILAKVAPEASSPAWPTPSPRDTPITIPSSSSSPVAAALWAQLRQIDRLFDLFSGYNHVMEYVYFFQFLNNFVLHIHIIKIIKF